MPDDLVRLKFHDQGAETIYSSIALWAMCFVVKSKFRSHTGNFINENKICEFFVNFNRKLYLDR